MAESENTTLSAHLVETLDPPAEPSHEVSAVEVSQADGMKVMKPMSLSPALLSKAEVEKGMAKGGLDAEEVDVTGYNVVPQVGKVGAEGEKPSRVKEDLDGGSIALTAPLGVSPSVPASSKEASRVVEEHVTEAEEGLEKSEQVSMIKVIEDEYPMDTLSSNAQGHTEAKMDTLKDAEKDVEMDTESGKEDQREEVLTNDRTDGLKDQEVSSVDNALSLSEAEQHSSDVEDTCVSLESTDGSKDDWAGSLSGRQLSSSPSPSAIINNGKEPQEIQMEVGEQLLDEPCEVETSDSARESVSPPVKIKDEPMDEEYDRALVPQSTAGGIKDEPDTTEEFGLQHKTSEELKISAVFSVGGNAAPAAPASVAQPVKEAAAPPKTVTLTAPPPPAPAPAPSTVPPLAPLSGVRVSCSGCKKVLLKGQTAYQRKGSSQLFCSTICLTSYTLPTIKSILKKICHYCRKDIDNPKDVIIAPVDMAGTVKDFCSQTCLSSFDFKRKTAVSTLSSEGVTIKCSVCNNMAVIRHEVNYQGTVHKLCSDSCFTRFRLSNNLTMNCCENCGGYCYSGHGMCHMLQIEGANKKLCSPSCVTAYKMKSVKVTPCAMCRTLRSSAEMVEHVTSQGKTELFCNSTCVTAHKVQTASTSGSVLPCDQCKVTAVPQYHLAMSDGSMRNFCSYSCVLSFQTAFNKATTQTQISVIPSPVIANTTAPAQPTVTNTATTASTDSPVVSAPPAGALAQLATRAQTRLSCKHCCRLFASKPELFEFKGEMILCCGKTCSEEYKRANVVMARCEYCKIDKVVKEVKKINKQECSFCSEGCKLLYKHDLAKRWGIHCRNCAYCGSTSPRLVQSQFSGKLEEFCGDECMSQYAVLVCQMSKCDACKRQGKLIESLRWLGEMKHFCNLLCLLQFCSQQSPSSQRAKPAPVTIAPQTTAKQAPATIAPAPPTTNVDVPAPSNLVSKEATPIIASVVSLASAPTNQPTVYANTALQGAVPVVPAKVIEHASTQTDALKLPPAPPARMLKNKALLCKPMCQNKGTICKPNTQSTETQTEVSFPKVIVLPVPVPVFVPVPMHLYTQYTPSAVGLPVPVPVPMFLPTTLDSAERIIETIQQIKNKIPSNPYEADLILMADLVAEEDEEKEKPPSHGDQGSSYSGDLESEAVSTPHSWEDDVTSSAQKHTRAAEQDVTPAPAPPPPPPQLDLEADFPIESFDPSAAPAEDSETISPLRPRPRRRPRDGFPPRKRGRKRSGPTAPAAQPHDSLPTPGALRLHQQYGVNAWKTWVQWRATQPDMENPRFGSRPMVFKEDILRCSTAELSYGLCRFISEVRRPNGEPYTPDSIFYLCLGIQQHLFENGRLENIFTDVFYGKFTSEITRLLKAWKPPVLPSGFPCSRVEEEYLWECKQLGAYSPIVLLNTLLFFSTKLFRLKTVSQHHRLSFAHVMRCTKTLKDNQKTCFLRFYPPGAKEDEKATVPSKRKKDEEHEEDVLEMPENTENPLRCPVRLYEFYLSKCSDTVKQRTDLFYLQPERSCVPNSPMWYSSVPLDDSILESMLTRILTVREVHQEVESSSDAEVSD